MLSLKFLRTITRSIYIIIELWNWKGPQRSFNPILWDVQENILSHARKVTVQSLVKNCKRELTTTIGKVLYRSYCQGVFVIFKWLLVVVICTRYFWSLFLWQWKLGPDHLAQALKCLGNPFMYPTADIMCCHVFYFSWQIIAEEGANLKWNRIIIIFFVVAQLSFLLFSHNTNFT